MNGCKDILPLVAARPLGVLDPHEESGVALHLDRCEACRAFAQDVDAALVECTPTGAHAPEAAWGRIAAGIGGATTPRRVGLGLPAIAALLLGALALPVFVLRGGSTPEAEVAERRATALPPAPKADPAPLAPPTEVEPPTPPEEPVPEEPTEEPAAHQPGHEDVAAVDSMDAPLRLQGQRPGVVGRTPGPAPAVPGAFAPEGAKELIERAWEKVKREDWATAEGLVDEALRLEPGLSEGWELRARVHLAQGRIEEATADLHRAIELDPRQAEVWLLLADVRARTGAYAEALASVDRALALDPTRLTGYGLRARIRLALGDPPGALSDAERLIELRPDEPEAYVLRAAIRDALDDADGRDRDLERARELGGDGPPSRKER